MATTIRTRRYSLLGGILISIIGFIIFLNFSADDFLSPGLVQARSLLHGTQLEAQEYVSAPFILDELKPVSILISTSSSPVAFDIIVEGPSGTVLHNTGEAKSTFTFTPDSKGDYLVTIKNLSSKTTFLDVNEGYLKTYENTQVVLVVLAMFMIIGGNYLIVNNYFSSLQNYS